MGKLVGSKGVQNEQFDNLLLADRYESQERLS